jgi:hypothetical protein
MEHSVHEFRQPRSLAVEFPGQPPRWQAVIIRRQAIAVAAAWKLAENPVICGCGCSEPGSAVMLKCHGSRNIPGNV